MTVAVTLVGCGEARPPESVASIPVASLPGHASLAVDTTPKEDLRMVPPEAYLRTYVTLFGGLAPLDVQQKARSDGTFDAWSDYFTSLGFPDYRLDMPRGTQTNAMMLAAFERLGISLCDHATLHDLNPKTPVPIAERVVFSFDAPKGALDLASFSSRFDVLHRRFLGYPAALAETPRAQRFFDVYTEIVNRHVASAKTTRSRFTPEQAGWAAVCYGLVRHPEFHLY
jgi:hypothetical protein